MLRGHSYKYKCFCKGFYADTAGALTSSAFFLSSKRIAAATKISPIPGPIWLLASKDNKEQKAPITNTNIPAAAGNNAPNKLHKKFIFFYLALLFFVGQKMLIHKRKRNQHHGHP